MIGYRSALARLLAGLAVLAVGQPATAEDYAARFATACAACHGAQGLSVLADTPSLAGQHSFYAVTQLFLFREGRREAGPMTAIAKGMSDADLRGFSELIGRLPVASPDSTAPTDAARQARGAALAQQMHCLSCHGPSGEGGKQVPRVAGQREDYLRLALRGFRAGTRVGYTAAMSEALAGATPAQIDDLAYFLARLGVQVPAR